MFAGPTAQRRARSSGLRSVLRTKFFQFTMIADLSLGQPHGPRSKHPWIPSMALAAAWERPWKPPKCFICKLQSDSWKTSIFTCRPSRGNENHSFATVGNVKWTLNFHGFLTFLWIPNSQKTKKTINITFAQGFPLFWALGPHHCIRFSIEILNRIY